MTHNKPLLTVFYQDFELVLLLAAFQPQHTSLQSTSKLFFFLRNSSPKPPELKPNCREKQIVGAIATATSNISSQLMSQQETPACSI